MGVQVVDVDRLEGRAEAGLVLAEPDVLRLLIVAVEGLPYVRLEGRLVVGEAVGDRALLEHEARDQLQEPAPVRGGYPVAVLAQEDVVVAPDVVVAQRRDRDVLRRRPARRRRSRPPSCR